MQLIRCTAKLLKEIGLSPTRLQHQEPKFSFLGQWHANLIYIDRRKCVLFVNDRTLFNFIVPHARREQIRALDEMFQSWLACVLSAEGISDDVISRILSEYDEIEFGKSSDRSVLGCANDIAFHYKYLVSEAGGVHSWMVPDIIREMNRMPMHASKRQSVYPINELEKLYGIAV